MQEKRQLRGHVIRDALEKGNKGQPMFCGRCGILGIVGADLHIVYTEHSPAPMFGYSYIVWAACGDTTACEQRQLKNKKSK
jgi:hypothetical protein